MRDVLIVGEDFGRSDPRYHSDTYALTGASGKRLASLCGYDGDGTLPVLQFCQDFLRTNVVTLPQEWGDRDAVERGVQRVRDAIARMRHDEGHRRVIFLGGKVARAFAIEDLPILEWIDSFWAPGYAVDLARAPHPSGRNHWWNDPDNVVAARDFWERERTLIDARVAARA